MIGTLRADLLKVSRSTVLFGPPKTGKTEAVVYLLKKGLKVLYLDYDANTLPFRECTDSELENLTYIRLFEADVGHNYNATYAFFKGRPLKLCAAHRVHDCNTCKLNKIPPEMVLSISEVPAGTVIVVDSYTSLQNSAYNFLLEWNKIDPLKIQSTQLNFYSPFQSMVEGLWGSMMKPLTDNPIVVICHSTDLGIKSPIANDKARAFPEIKVPQVGTRSYALDKSAIVASAIVATEINKPPIVDKGKGYLVSCPIPVKQGATLGEILYDLVTGM